MEFLKVFFLVVISLVVSINGNECDELSNFCTCQRDTTKAMALYTKSYTEYHNHIKTLRHEIHTKFGSRLNNCTNNMCKYFYNYEDALINRCLNHHVLESQYQPVWDDKYRNDEEDRNSFAICSWIVIHGPVLCAHLSTSHTECNLEDYFEQTFGAIAKACTGEVCKE